MAQTVASIRWRPSRFRALAATFLGLLLVLVAVLGAAAARPDRPAGQDPPAATIRVATFRGEIEGSVTLLERSGRLRVDLALTGLPSGGVRLVAWNGRCSDVFGRRTSLGVISPLHGRVAGTWQVSARGRNADLGSLRLRQRGVLLACRDLRTGSADRDVCVAAPAVIAGCRATIVVSARAGGMIRQGVVFHLVEEPRRPARLVLTEVASSLRSIVLGGRTCANGGGRTLARLDLPTRHGIHRIPVAFPRGVGAERVRSFRFGPRGSLCTDALVLARPVAPSGSRR